MHLVPLVPGGTPLALLRSRLSIWRKDVERSNAVGQGCQIPRLHIIMPAHGSCLIYR
jgi:hypothetical protein